MTDPTKNLYRYKFPSDLVGCKTVSFEIEPYYVRSDGREIKAGKAIIRCVIYPHIGRSAHWATLAADEIVQQLNAGRKYHGPKVLHFDKPHFFAFDD